MALKFLLHPVPLFLTLFIIFTNVVILPCFLLELLFNFLFLLTNILQIYLELLIPLLQFVYFHSEGSNLLAVRVFFVFSLPFRGLECYAKFLQFFFELIFLHFAIVIILSQIFIIMVNVLQLLTQILNIFAQLPLLKLKSLILQFLSLYLSTQLVAFQLQHRNHIILYFYFRALGFFANYFLSLLLNFGLLFLCKVFSLNEFFLQLEITIEFGDGMPLFVDVPCGRFSLIYLFSTAFL